MPDLVMARMDSLLPEATYLARKLGKTVKLLRFSQREELRQVK